MTANKKSMAKQGILLVVDDNRNILTSLQYLLGEYFERVITIDSPVTVPTLLNRADRTPSARRRRCGIA